MKTLATACFIACSGLSIATTAQADGGTGTVNFSGTVINAPCNIALESTEQTIDFGQISNSSLNAGTPSAQQPLEIKLIGCDAAVTTVSVTFDGTSVAGDDTQLATTGGTFAAIQILKDGAPITLRTPVDMGALAAGDNTLTLQSHVMLETGQTAAVEGAFAATSTFTLTYA